MNSKEKVFVILTPGFAVSESDTSCLPMQQSFVHALSNLYPEIKIIVLSFHYPFFKKTYSWFNASITSFNGKNRGGLSALLLRKNVSQALEKIHSKKRIIGVLSFWLGECAYVGKRFAKKNGMKHYSWLFGQDASAGNKYPSKLYVKENELIALSDFLQDEFERNYSIRPTIVIPPGIEKQVQDENPRDIDMLAVGSLIPLKRFEIFVEIVATIRKQIPTINAMIVGDGPERNKLKNLVSTLGLEGNINFTGAVDHQQVLNLMQRAKVLLHPSSYEGFSGVCQEALNSGMHVVSFSRAMNYDIRQWHIVQTKTEMTQRAISILTNRFVEFVPVPFPSMIDTARQIMNCYL